LSRLSIATLAGFDVPNSAVAQGHVADEVVASEVVDPLLHSHRDRPCEHTPSRPLWTPTARWQQPKLYDRKTRSTAAERLNDRVVPLFDAHKIPLLRVLTDRGTEYCGNPEHHAYQLYLAVEDIDRTHTRARSPQTNGMCERFHKTDQDEFYSVAFRKKLYTSLDELQADLDEWIQWYNTERTHSGRYCYDKTPMQTFKDAKVLAKQKELDSQHLTPSGPSHNPQLSGKS
jgi:hypothetical protein